MDFFKKSAKEELVEGNCETVGAAQAIEPQTLLEEQLEQLEGLDSQIDSIESDEDWKKKASELKTLKKSKKVIEDQLNKLVMGNAHLMKGKPSVEVNNYNLRVKTSTVVGVSDTPNYKAIMDKYPTVLAVKVSAAGLKQMAKAVPTAMVELESLGLALNEVKSIEIKAK